MESICLEFPRYGYRRVTRQLQREGWRVNHKKVLRLMRENDLLCRVQRRWTRTTDSDHPYRVYPNLLRDLQISRLNQVWLADITYIRILTGFVYLAAVLDAYSRKVVGHAISSWIDTALTLRALRMAIERRHPEPGCIHHSDQGVQYASHEYVQELKQHGFRISMSRRGNVYDNAMMESFIKTLKCEEVYLWDYRTLADVESGLPYFIEEVYNRKRLHSALGYRPPNEFEKLLQATQNGVPTRQIALTYSVQS
jgi:transposase InsO family protein